MLSIKVDTSGALSWLNEVANEQIPYAAMKALNQTAVEFQAAQFAHEQDIFKLRRADWIKKSTKIDRGDFATKRKLSVRIHVEPPGGDARSDVIAKFEDDTQKTSILGHDVAVPVGVRRSKKDIVRGDQRPKAFHFHQVGRTIRGDRGTFIVDTGRGFRLILQRTRAGVKALYYLFHHVPIVPDLQFEKTAEITVVRRWDENFAEWFHKAMATARE